jgi:dephospho-CoA kinase
MRTVGITGGIGSGKTTVCRIFELMGIPVFYADTEAKKLYDVPEIRSKVVALFGKKVLAKGGKIDKKKLADIVFDDRSALSKINSLIHPAVRQRFLEWKKQQKRAPYVIKEAAIMIESGAYKELDHLISVTSPKSLRISRVIGRDNVVKSNIEKRISEQISDIEREKCSDKVIVNDERHSLIEQVLRIHRSLSRK